MDLNIVYDFIEKMNATTSSNDKINLIRFSKPVTRKVLFYTYNTFQQYNITPKVLNKTPASPYPILIDALEIKIINTNANKITGNPTLGKFFIINNNLS